MPVESNLRKDRFLMAHSLKAWSPWYRTYSGGVCLGQLHGHQARVGQSNSVSQLVTSALGKQTRKSNPVCGFLFIQSKTQDHGMESPLLS